jgi:CDP-diacylglycerol--serine O-phosphatidyltransferase
MKKVAFVPTLITLGNCVAGYGSIVYAARASAENHWPFEIAAGFIFLGMTFDALDGKIARLTKMATAFGAQLDSIADITTFGLAPAFLVWEVLYADFPGFSKFGWLVSALFLMAAAIRLARFNIHNSADERGHRSFQGLPSPAAAGTIAAIVVLHVNLLESRSLFGGAYRIQLAYVAAGLPFVMLVLAVLMISKIRYAHLMHELFKDRRNFGFLSIFIIAAIAVAYTYWFSLALIFLGYVLSPFIGVAVEQLLDRIELSHEKDSFF